jgi:2,4-dienoyl-CoA reductase-like NADH-dependent reductase (Old Yellow Enzyme family)
MDPIFSPWKMGSLEIPNRLVRSATWEGMAQDDGAVTDALAEVTAKLAHGGVGLIITGYAFVLPEGRGLPKQTGVHSDELVDSLGRMTDAVHEAGGLVALQIVHAGAQTRSEWIGTTARGPSAVIHPSFGESVEELTRDQISGIVTAFASAARRARAARFDAVQLHAAHGYLINQFLSPQSNRRDDDYGGSIEGRARLCFEIFDAVRAEVGPDFPVFIKLNSEDCVEGGLELADAVEVARGLSERGIDAIEVSGGVPYAGKKGAARLVRNRDEEAYFLANARAIKEVVDCPVVVVGGIRSRSVIEHALEEIDAVSICRPFIRQPDLANLMRDRVVETADCVSCGKCLEATMEHGLSCGVLIGEEARLTVRAGG